MTNKKQGTGFTLIELVVIIVVLGILAAVAAPRFINLSSDARISALQGVEASIISAGNLVLAKANVEGVADQENGNVDIDNDGINDVAITFGYPIGDRSNGIPNVVELGNDWAFGDNNGGNGGSLVFITSASLAGFSGITNNNIPIRSTNCYIQYAPPSSAGDSPDITFFTNDC